MLLLTQPRIPVAFLATRTHRWLIWSACCPTRSPRSSSAKLSSSLPAPSIHWYTGLFFARCRTCTSFCWPVSPLFQPVEVPLDSSMTLWCTSHPSQFCNSSRLAEDTLCSIVQIINEDTEQYGTQNRPLGYNTTYWLPTRLCTTDHQPLSSSIHPVFNPIPCLLIQPTLHRLIYENLMSWESGQELSFPFPFPENNQLSQSPSFFQLRSL